MGIAKEYVEQVRREIEASRESRLWKDSINMLNTVSESVFSRSAHFILELLQNAEDAGPKSVTPAGEIEFSISPNRIKITHNGLPFAAANVDAICGVRSSKKPEEGTLGFLGIGFKSVFKITNSPQIHSGEFHFKFDRAAHQDPANVPWQIIPIWEETPSEAVNPALTTFIVPFKNDGFYQQTFGELKKIDVHVFLFLRWLKRLQLVDETGGGGLTVENLGEADGFLTLKRNGVPQRFVIQRRLSKVPPDVAADPALVFYKRENVLQREVVIAFAVDKDGNLRSMEDASALGSVSSFLPLVEERSGAKFLIQADFLVQPGREAIQYELAWNRWLVREAVEAAKDIIPKFKADQRWRNQFLPLFNFRAYSGQPAYDKLFGPELKQPLLSHLLSGEVVATSSREHSKAGLVVRPEDGLNGLLTDADLPLLFPGTLNLKLIDPLIDFKALPDEIQQAVKSVDMAKIARNKKVLETRIGQPEWFQKLYRAMAASGRSFKNSPTQGRRGRILWVEDPIFVPTETNQISSAKGVHLRKIPTEVADLRDKFKEVSDLLASYKLLHPCLDDQESDELSKFFTEQTHVEAIDYDKICRTVFLPKVRTDTQAPPKGELIAYTRLLQKGPSVSEPIWALNKAGILKPSNELFMGTAWSPSEDWEKNAQFMPQLDFLTAEYLDGVPADQIADWKKFFLGVGVKESGERNHVESFAMAFVQDKLAAELSDFVAKDRQQVGYDREAKRKKDGAMVRLEIKGQKQNQPVNLVGKEPDAAQAAANNGEPFWLCVVPGIPKDPELWVIENVVKAGSFETLTVDVSKWKTHGRRAV